MRQASGYIGMSENTTWWSTHTLKPFAVPPLAARCRRICPIRVWRRTFLRPDDAKLSFKLGGEDVEDLRRLPNIFGE